MPAASRPGSSTIVAAAPPTAMASISRNAPSSGEPSSAEMAAKLPAPPITSERLGGRVLLDEPHGQRGQPAAEGDERRLRADDGAEAERDHRSEEHAGQLDGRRCALARP